MLSNTKRVIRTNLMSDIGMLHIKTFEYFKVRRDVLEVGKELGYKSIYLWRKGDGLLDLLNGEKYISKLAELVAKADSEPIKDKTLIIFQDVHRIYDDYTLLVQFQKLVEQIVSGVTPVNTIGMSPSSKIPEEIERFTQIESTGFPSKEDIKKQIVAHMEDSGIYLGRAMIGRMAESLSGLIEDEISLLLNRIIVTAFREDRLIDEKILTVINEQKKQVIQKSGLIEFVNPNISIDSVGGLHNLKRWLRERKTIFDDRDKALAHGVKIPKGILLFGMPGSGKSLVSKVSANYFNLPLLRVDMGLVYGQKSPEEAMGRMAALADAISPCVLWIDEIEKALSGAENGANNDVAIKILGILLTWMQERTKPVFIIATANDISMIRPELYRDGRIDEKFMLGFLGDDMQQIDEIIKIQLKARLKDKYDDSVRPLDIEAIAKKMKQMVAKTTSPDASGYTGANIEALVEKVLHNKYVSNKPFVETRDFIRTLNNVFPQQGLEIKKMLKRAQEIEAIRA